MPSAQPYLSVVVVTRNDDHGGNLAARTQCFIDTLAEGADRHGIAAELVVVEWNPPRSAAPIAELLSWPGASRRLDARIITVSGSLHHQLANSDRIPLYQMIGKNVGIARARGRFVLATNIDVLLSDALLAWLRAKALLRGCLYRAARADVPSSTTALADYGERLAFCAEHARPLNDLASCGADASSAAIGARPPPQRCALSRGRRRLRALIVHPSGPAELGEWGLPSRFARFRKYLEDKRHPIRPLHTTAAGDFTLLSRDDWQRLRGYAEWPIYSWNIDALLLYQAQAAGVDEIDLGPRRTVYHIDHSPGSGWTPQHGDALFHRLEQRQLPYLDDIALGFAIRRLLRRRQPAINDANWGLGNVILPEIHFPRGRSQPPASPACRTPRFDGCDAMSDRVREGEGATATTAANDPSRDIVAFAAGVLPSGSGVVQIALHVTAGQLSLALQPRKPGYLPLPTTTIAASAGPHVIELPVPELSAIGRLLGCGQWSGDDSRFTIHRIEFLQRFGADTGRRARRIAPALLTAQNGGAVAAAGDDGVEVTTAADCWVYSAALPIDTDNDVGTAPAAVRLRVLVDSGIAGFLLTVKGEHNAHACAVTLSASGAEKTVYLPVAALDAAGYFIVRNESPYGPTRLRLRSVEIIDTSLRI